MSSFRKRLPLEPPEKKAAVDRVRRIGRDPSPTFSLNARQLEILEARKQREQPQQNSSRSSTTTSEESSNRTPSRTPNPISRSAMSGVPSESASSAQKAFLRQMLQKATSKQQQQQQQLAGSRSQSSSSHYHGDADPKALLKKVLHKTMGQKRSQQQEDTKSSRSQQQPSRWKSKDNNDKKSRTQERTSRRASIFRNEIKPDQVVDETIRQTFRRRHHHHHREPEQTIAVEKQRNATVQQDDGLEGYETFLQTLKTEVSGQHSQVGSF